MVFLIPSGYLRYAIKASRSAYQDFVASGVVHGYKNVSKTTRGMILNYPDKLFMGWNRNEEVDEIRHEEKEDNEFMME